MRILLIVFLLSLFSIPLHAAEEVNLYSARKEKLIKPLLDDFTKETGIKVNLVTAKADALIERLKAESKNSPADLLITTDAGRLYRAKTQGLLQPINSDVLQNSIPVHLRDPNNYWFGLSVRARPIFYVKGKVDPSELSTYEALADDKWKKRICIRSSSNIYNQSLIASMIATNGPIETAQWLDQFVPNFARKPKGGDRDQIKAAAAGMCDIAIANTYYYGKMINGKDKAQQQAAAKVAIFWPNQADRGTHINVSGAGVTRSASNIDNAKKLLEFLVSDHAQRWYAEVNNEYPVREGVASSKTLAAWGEFTADTVNMDELGKKNSQAVRLMDRAGWK